MSIWDELDKEMSVDNRIGNHDFVVDSVNRGQWPSGDEYIELDGRLTTADNFNIKQRFSPTLSEEELAARLPNMDRSAKQGALLAHKNAEVLEKEYNTRLETIKGGDVFRVKTDKQTNKNDSSKYFIRLVNFLPKTAGLSGNGSTSNVPF